MLFMPRPWHCFCISLPQWCASPAILQCKLRPSPLGFASSQVQVRSLEKLTKSSQAFAFRRSFVKYGTNLLFDLFMTNTDYQHFTRYPNIFQWKRIYFMYIEADDNCQIRWVFKFFEVSLSWPEDLPLRDLRHAFPRAPLPTLPSAGGIFWEFQGGAGYLGSPEQGKRAKMFFAKGLFRVQNRVTKTRCEGVFRCRGTL